MTFTDSNNVAICLFLPARPRGVLHSDQEAGSGWRDVPGEYGLLLAAALRLVTFSLADLTAIVSEGNFSCIQHSWLGEHCNCIWPAHCQHFQQ